MTATRIHCQVLQVDEADDWAGPRRRQPSDLLPWADPYIARLIRRLETRYNIDDGDDELSDPFAADDAPWLAADDWHGGDCDDGWEDAFMPPPLEGPRCRWYPPVYGGFPLLDDIHKDDDADSL